jgi:hypothetical protein
MSPSRAFSGRSRHRAAPWRSWLLLRRCATPAPGGASGSKLKRLLRVPLRLPCPSPHVPQIRGVPLRAHFAQPHGHAELCLRATQRVSDTTTCVPSWLCGFASATTGRGQEGGHHDPRCR